MILILENNIITVKYFRLRIVDNNEASLKLQNMYMLKK